MKHESTFKSLCIACAVSATVILWGAGTASAVPTQADLDAARAQLEQLGSEMASIQSQLMESEMALEETRNKIHDTQTEIDDTNEQLIERRGFLGRRMKSSYKSGAGNILDMIFGARNFEDLVNIIYYLDKVSESDAEAIGAIQELELALEQQMGELEAAEADQQVQIEQTEAQLGQYDEMIAEAQAYYDQLDAEIQAELARQAAEEEARRQAEAEAAQAATAAAQSSFANAVSAIDTGDNGAAAAPAQQEEASSTGDEGTDEAPAEQQQEEESSESSSSQQQNSIVASSDVIANAYALCGKPYKTWWSGVNYGPYADGYDCCGLVATSYQMAGYSTPYQTSVSGLMSWVQSRGNWKSCNLSNYQSVLNPGDIIFCSTGHVAIYIGGEYMIHAPYPGQYVCVAWVYDCIGGGFGG